MKYIVKFEKRSIKNLQEIDKKQARLIVTWIENNLSGTDDPRRTGRPLKGKLKEYWRYRVGQYRIIVEIVDEKLIILVISIGHRKSVYIK